MSKSKNFRTLKIQEVRGELKKLAKKFANNDLFPPPPAPIYKINVFKSSVSYIGTDILVRISIYSKRNVYRKIFRFNQNEYNRIIPFLNHLVDSKVYYANKYNRNILFGV